MTRVYYCGGAPEAGMVLAWGIMSVSSPESWRRAMSLPGMHTLRLDRAHTVYSDLHPCLHYMLTRLSMTSDFLNPSFFLLPAFFHTSRSSHHALH